MPRPSCIVFFVQFGTEKCNLLYDTHFRMRRASSACGHTFSVCREPASHAEVSSPRAETLLHMRRCLLGMRRLCSACGGSVLTCGDLFFKPSQPSRFITPPVLIVASILAWLTSWEASSAGTVTSTRLWLPGMKGVASETRSGDDQLQNQEPECVTIR